MAAIPLCSFIEAMFSFLHIILICARDRRLETSSGTGPNLSVISVYTESSSSAF